MCISDRPAIMIDNSLISLALINVTCSRLLFYLCYFIGSHSYTQFTEVSVSVVVYLVKILLDAVER